MYEDVKIRIPATGLFAIDEMHGNRHLYRQD